MKIALSNCPPERADAIAQQLVEERLVACVNLLPVRSFYIWKDFLQKDEEVTLMMKVPAEGVDRLRARLRELHPYELPEFVVLDVDLPGSLPEYVAWVRASAAG